MTPLLALDSIEISNFRALRYLKLDGLAHVNLIVGKNNVGKTTLLEAIWVYAQGGAPKALLETLEGRNEASLQLNGQGKTYTIQDQFDSLRHLASQRRTHKLSESTNDRDIQPITISISSKNIDAAHSLTIFTGPYELKSVQNGTNGVVKAQPIYYKDGDPSLLIMHDQKAFTYSLRSGTFEAAMSGHPSFQLPPTIEKKTYFAQVEGFEIDQINTIWDDLLLRDSANDIVNCLQIIAPEIERINLVSVPGQNHRQPFAKLSGLDDPVTLKSLGEGLNRLFGVAVILVLSKGGIALIDEIDTGLHYSVLPRFWEFVFKAAQRLNVQIFATTHSWDCIEGFSEALQNDATFDARLISLRKSRKPDDDTIHAIYYDRRQIAIATKEDIEVR